MSIDDLQKHRDLQHGRLQQLQDQVEARYFQPQSFAYDPIEDYVPTTRLNDPSFATVE